MQDNQGRILVVDDHVEMTRLLADRLADAGYTVDVASSYGEAMAQLKANKPDAVLTDLRMEGQDGFDVLEAVHVVDPELPVLIMTAFGAIETAIAAIKRGAYHYVTKPFQLDEVLVYLTRAVAERSLRAENRTLRRIADLRVGLGAMIGRSNSMAALYDLVERVAKSDFPTLIRGESGAGKELVARTLHYLGPRRDRAFVAVNCTALPAALLESELFGHVRGAFTGASVPRRGLFVEADGGTLFLDEIGDMPKELQAKLLRVLEDGEVRAVGADGPRRVDVRILAATHQDLDAHVQSGAFRADLFYRLNVVPIQVPPLRERLDDFPDLIALFFKRVAGEGRVRSLSPRAMEAITSYHWPGNVRELENLIKRLAVVTSSDVIELEDLVKHAPGITEAPPPLRRTKLVPLRQVEDEYIAWVLDQCAGNKTKAAEVLGIDVSTLYRRDRSK